MVLDVGAVPLALVASAPHRAGDRGGMADEHDLVLRLSRLVAEGDYPAPGGRQAVSGAETVLSGIHAAQICNVPSRPRGGAGLVGIPSEQVRADSSPSTVLVKVGGRAITRADFEQFKARLVQATAEDAQTDSALLRSLVDKTVLVMEATSLGIDREPGFRKKLLQFGGRQISKRYSSQEIQRKVSVSAEELLQHFHATDRDRALRLAIILVPTRAQAAQVLEELEEGVPFAQLARERSEHETRDQGGDAGVYHLKDTAAEPIRDPVFKLAVGELSESLAFHGKWAVIKILDEIPVPLAQVEDIVRGEVLQRKVKERTRTVADSLFQAYAPELIEPNIAQLSQAFARDVADSSRFDDQVLCTFAGGRVTFGNLRALVPRADFSNADNVDSLVKDILPLRLFLEEGLRLGLDVHPAIEAAMKDERENLLVSRVRKQSVDDLIPEPTIEEARNFYAQHPEKFQTLETIVATEILVMFKDRAEELREQIDAGADPAELASLHSIREGAAGHGGRIKLTKYGEALFPGRWDIAKELGIGEVAGPVKVKEGFTILVVRERLPSTTKPFSAFSERRARAYITRHRSGLKYVDFIRGLRQKHGVEVFEERL